MDTKVFTKYNNKNVAVDGAIVQYIGLHLL